MEQYHTTGYVVHIFSNIKKEKYKFGPPGTRIRQPKQREAQLQHDRAARAPCLFPQARNWEASRERQHSGCVTLLVPQPLHLCHASVVNPKREVAKVISLTCQSLRAGYILVYYSEDGDGGSGVAGLGVKRLRTG